MITLSARKLALLLALNAVDAGNPIATHVSEGELADLGLVRHGPAGLALTPHGYERLSALREHLWKDLKLRLSDLSSRCA